MRYVAVIIAVFILSSCQTAPNNADSRTENPKEVVSVLHSVGRSFDIRDTGVKYCPVDGKHFSSRVNVCPEHKVKLIPVE